MARLSAPPRLPDDLGDLSTSARLYLERLSKWTMDTHASLGSALRGLERDKQGKALPIEVPSLANGDLNGTRFRYGGPPAIVAVLDAPGGATLALRDGSAWRLLGGGGGGGGGNYFGVIAVAGQGNVSADSDPDTVTFATSGGLAITTTPGSDTVTWDLDADLDAIAALVGVGFAARTTSNTWAQRSIAAGQGIVVADGDGVGGDPTISAPTAPAINYLDSDKDTTSTSPASIDDLEFAVESGQSYHFRFNLVYSEEEDDLIEVTMAGPSASIFNAVQLSANQMP